VLQQTERPRGSLRRNRGRERKREGGEDEDEEEEEEEEEEEKSREVGGLRRRCWRSRTPFELKHPATARHADRQRRPRPNGTGRSGCVAPPRLRLPVRVRVRTRIVPLAAALALVLRLGGQVASGRLPRAARPFPSVRRSGDPARPGLDLCRSLLLVERQAVAPLLPPSYNDILAKFHSKEGRLHLRRGPGAIDVVEAEANERPRSP